VAFVILPAHGPSVARLRTVRVRWLAAVAGLLLGAALLAGMALGLQVARSDGPATGGDVPDPLLALDSSRPGDQALIEQLAILSGRLVRLEAEAGRLATRVGVPPEDEDPDPDAASGNPGPGPAGGPMLAPFSAEGRGSAPTALELARSLDELETRLAHVTAAVARRDLHGMAFPSRPPLPGVAPSSGFGRRLDPFTGRPARHTGLDYAAPHGSPVLASAGGRVRRAGPYGAYGRTVEIDHGGGLVTRYGHLSRILVRKGDVLLPGQQIATVGSTGRSTGPHLHFEVLQDGTAVRPELFLDGRGS
jgi:murein DD-endopeptidase MepM/ murein hydrolase activator NlpD